MTVNGVVTTATDSFDAESTGSEYDSGHTSPSTTDYVFSPEEIQEIDDDLDLNEEGITDDEIIRRKTRIFVGGLKFESESVVLDDYFSTFGRIKEAVVIKDRKTGLSKGYGFVTMFEASDALKAIVNKSPKLDGRKCNVNLAYIGQKKKPPSKKPPELRLKDIPPLSGQLYNYNSNGYVVSPTIITPTGQYYQLGLPPLHGHQPVYHIPPSPTHLYDTPDNYSGQPSISPISPMSPLFQPQVYYSHPVLISPAPMTYPMYENLQCNSVSGISLEMVNNNPQDSNNNPAIHVNNNVVATMVPTSSEINNTSQQQQQQPYSPVIPTIPGISTSAAGTQNTLVVNNAYNNNQQHQSLSMSKKPLPANSNMGVGCMTPSYSPPQHSVYSSATTVNNNNNLSIMNGGVNGSHSGNIHLMNNNNIIHSSHPHLIAAGSHVMSAQNVSATTFLTSPLPSPSMQGPNQTQMFHMPSPPHFVNQQREIVTHRV